MLNNEGLGFIFTAKDLASGVIGNLERSFLSLDKKVGLGTERIKARFRELGLGLTIFTTGAVAVGAGFALAQAAGEFQTQVAAVGAISGASAADLDRLRDAAINAGMATQYAPQEATLALRELAAAGYTATESIQLLAPVLDLAGGSLGELSPQSAAGLAAQAMKAFGISTEEAAISVDRMLAAVNVFALGAGELPLALGISSRGAQALNQSLSETLISMGLVKNIIPTVERSSTAVAVAMERLVDPKAQKRLSGIGVAVVDSSGKFRDFLDILKDLSPALAAMTEAGRGDFLRKTFGAEALAGINAILTQLGNGIKNEAGEILQGADAVAYLRGQFEGAGGTAQKFREKMLSTFEGQGKLVSGALKTLAIVVGEPFAEVFQPLIRGFLSVVRSVVNVFGQLPAGIKRGLAAFIVGAGSVLAFVGSIVAVKASIALFLIALKAAGVTLGGIAAILAPAIVLFGLLALAVAGFYVAFRDNVGGIADFFESAWGRVSLGFRGLVQLFRDGGLTGAVKDALVKPENAGLLQFLIDVFLWGHRIWAFLRGIGRGFAGEIEAARPTISAFVDSLRGLGIALGLLSERDDDASTAISRFLAFLTAGEETGTTFARVFTFLIWLFTVVTDLTAGLVDGWHDVEPAVDIAVDAFTQLGSKLNEVTGNLFRSNTATDGAGSGWSTFGSIIGAVAGLIVGIIGIIVSVISAAIAVLSAAIEAVLDVFSGIADVVNGVITILAAIMQGEWAEVWTGAKLIVFGCIDAILGVIFELVGAVGGVFDALASIFGEDLHWQKGIREARESLRGAMAEGMGIAADVTFAPVASTPTPGASAPAPGIMSSRMPAAVAMSVQPPQMSVAPPQPAPVPPIRVEMHVDREVLASTVINASRDDASRSFSPVPSY